MNNGLIKEKNKADRAMMARNNSDSGIYPGRNKFHYLNRNIGKEEACQSGCRDFHFPECLVREN